MASLNEQLEKIEVETVSSTAEGILYDVLPQVFKNLNTRDLCRAEEVCSSWRTAVRTVFSKRTIQSLAIKAIHDESEDEDAEENKEEVDDDHDDDFASYHKCKYSQSKTHISNYLRNEPCHSLIFCGDKFPNDVDATDRIIRRYCCKIPVSNTVVIETLGTSIDKTPILESNDNVLGIFIPSNAKIKTRAYVPDYNELLEYPDENPSFLNEILGQLICDSEDHHCMIIFNLVMEYDYDSSAEKLERFARDILLDLRRIYKPGKFSLWGGSVRSMKSVGYDVLYDVESCWFGMSLTGPTLTSYSIAININLSDSEKEEKLKKFKSSIVMKTKTAAFAFVPASKSDSTDRNISKTDTFRKIFPKITLTSVYNTNELSQYSINTANDDLDASFEFMNCIAYLILTHS